ncbi:MAG: CRTAC1 family protein [Phycisphaerales bacterium]|nr:CRTAC1 family protein [Phycisphaerales bacterium]
MTTDPPSKTPDPNDEFDRQNDAIIGRAFGWSMVVFLGIAVLGGAFWVATTFREQPTEAVIEKQIAAPEALVADLAVIPDVAFASIGDEVGLQTTHVSGARGEKLLPETMGGGVAFVDFDDDGDQDLLLVSGAWWPHDQGDESADTETSVWMNDGSGHFEPASPAWNIGQNMYATGVAAGDYDSDGRIDIYLAGLHKDRLYRNTGNGLEDVTQVAGLSALPPQWSTSPAFIDVDSDGDLDLFVPHYVQWSREKDLALGFTINGTDRAYGPPKQYEGTHPTLFENQGDGTFVDVSAQSGMKVFNSATGTAVGKSLAVAPVDIDRDGDMDLIVANDTTRNFLYRNDGSGVFTEEGVTAGLAYDPRGQATGAMGIDVAHYRNDTALGIGIGNFANEMTSFYVAESPDGWFTDEAVVEGIGGPTRSLLSFGLIMLDYDLDGRLDLFQTNGHLEEDIEEVQASQHYRQPGQLFWNAGSDQGASFKIVPSDSAGALAKPIVGRGAAHADIDADGDLDLIVTQPGLPPVLLRNDQELGHHWLRLDLRDPQSSNTRAIGAWVEVVSGGVTQRRQVMPTRSYLSQVELPLTFGLGDSEVVDSVVIDWPDGVSEVVEVDAVDRLYRIERAR